MNQKAYSILNQFDPNYICIPHEGNTFVISLVPYQPFLKIDGDYASIDAYYLISNQNYLRVRTVCDQLSSCGVQTTNVNHVDLKTLLCNAKLVSRGENTLCLRSDVGSRFYIAAFLMEEKLDQRLFGTVSHDECLHCGACIRACPTKALSTQGWRRDLCLREQMERGTYSNDDLAKLADNRLLGCDICQQVCPKNATVGETAVPHELLMQLQIPVLWQSVCNQDLKPLSKYIGTNYAKQKRLINLLATVMINAGRAGYLERLYQEAERVSPQIIVRAQKEGEKYESTGSNSII